MAMSDSDSVMQHDGSRRHHHPDLGARIGRALGLPPEAVEIIALHQERWDGKGYPFGLKGDRIPFLARVVALAQAFDDLTADKPSGNPIPVAKALQQLEQQAGTAFDPLLVETFCRTMREQPPQG